MRSEHQRNDRNPKYSRNDHFNDPNTYNHSDCSMRRVKRKKKSEKQQVQQKPIHIQKKGKK